MRLEQECTDEIEKESMGREKEDPSPKKIHKFSRVFTVLRKFLVNESHELNTVRSQYRKEHFWSIVCCQPIHSEKKKNEANRNWYISGKNSWSIFKRNLGTSHSKDS